LLAISAVWFEEATAPRTVACAPAFKKSRRFIKTQAARKPRRLVGVISRLRRYAILKKPFEKAVTFTAGPEPLV
jgi:hypothetical protein